MRRVLNEPGPYALYEAAMEEIQRSEQSRIAAQLADSKETDLNILLEEQSEKLLLARFLASIHPS